MSHPYKIDAEKYKDRLARTIPYSFTGKVSQSVGLCFEAELPGAAIGSICRMQVNPGEPDVLCEVIGFRDNKVILMGLDAVYGVNALSKVSVHSKEATVKVGDDLLGRIVNGAGIPIDGKGGIEILEERSIYAESMNPMQREIIEEPLDLGVRAINGMLTCGGGQRMGIMAGSGVGKSVLMGMIARNTTADVNVIALIGERGREVREFIERDLGEEGLRRSVIVVATSDQSPLYRMRASFVATAIAEHFADEGKKVLLLMDSLTRFCMAQREIGLSLGEPPASKGYTPSVFSMLPKLLERAGARKNGGSITGLYTVLVEGDDMDDPVADSARSVLDGHIVLSRALAEKGHYPAIDVLASISRVMRSVVSEEHNDLANSVRELLATYKEAEDLINIGAYVRGSNHKIDQAIELYDFINRFLRQGVSEKANMQETVALMRAIVRGE